MTVSTAEDFYGVLEKSQLLTAEQLTELRRADPQGDNPREIAKTLARKELITRWQAGQLLAGRSSFYLGKYKLIDLLGRGGMGSVFLGQHTTMNRRVALKIIARHVSRDPASLDRFLSEARVIAALDHPNIVQAYSVDCEGDRYYIVMEYVDGRDLERVVERDGPLDFARAADYIAQAADGLAHGHQRGIIHCDIKPSNLLVNEQGVVKIVDMGLSRLANREDEVAQVVAHKRNEDHVLGTVDYLAPEQALKSKDFDHRADIYSLGCTFYFLLTGHPPFPEGTLPERIVKHQTQAPPPIADQRPDTPADLVEVCERMMAKDPADRFQTADQIGRSLASWRPGSGGTRGSGYAIVEPAVAGGGAFPAIQTEEKPLVRTNARKKEISSKEKTAAKAAPALTAATPTQAAAAGSAGLLATTRAKIIATIAGVVLLLLLAVGAGVGTALWLTAGSSDDDNASTLADVKEPSVEKPEEEPSDEAASGDAASGDADPETAQPGDGAKPAEGEQPGTNVEYDSGLADGEAAPAGDDPVTDAQVDPAVPTENESTDEPKAKSPDAESSSAPKEAPEEPAPDKPKEIDPFEMVPTRVTLTTEQGEVEPGKPIDLGKVQLKPDTALTVELSGGDKVLGKDVQLSLAAQPDGKTWRIRREGNGDRKAVGTVELAGPMLRFQWEQEVDRPTVLALQNCGLSLWASGKEHFLALSQPETAEPVSLNLDAGTSRARLTDRNLPDEDVLRLEVLGIGGITSKPNFKTAHTVDSNGTIEIELAQEGSPPLMLGVKFMARGRALNVEVEALVEGPGGKKVPFRVRMVQQALAPLLAQQQYGNQMLSKIKDKKQKEQAQAILNQLNEQIAQLNGYAELYKNLHGKANVQFRVFADVAPQHGVDLYSTEAAASQPVVAGPPGDDGPPIKLGGPDEAPAAEGDGSGIGNGFFD